MRINTSRKARKRMKFNKNDIIKHESKNYTIENKLGEGGQGVVYLLADEQGNKFALKVYKFIPHKDFVYNLKNNIAKGSPSSDFIWPKKLIEFNDGTFGYIMDLRPERYTPFSHYLNGKVKFASQRVMLDWCIRLVNSFKKLHEGGYSYQDLNDGSFYFDKDTGDLLICDNDNIAANKTNLGILGMMRFMAPEIVRGDIDKLTGQRFLPDTHSDRFSLAVILFMALCLANPFEGENLKKYDIVDEKAEFEMFGSKPVYIFNQNDASNRPIRGYHVAVFKRYPNLPSYIKEAFHKTFVDGLIDRENGRTTEIEWIKLLSKYRDELLTCKCGHEYIYGFNERKPNEKCPYCQSDTKTFCYLEINRNKILLEPGKKIYLIHIDKYSSQYTTPIGVVIRNKNNPSLWGIKMTLDRDILIKDAADNEKTIPMNGVLPIVNNLKINFGDNVTGKITTITK